METDNKWVNKYNMNGTGTREPMVVVLPGVIPSDTRHCCAVPCLSLFLRLHCLSTRTGHFPGRSPQRAEPQSPSRLPPTLSVRVTVTAQPSLLRPMHTSSVWCCPSRKLPGSIIRRTPILWRWRFSWICPLLPYLTHKPTSLWEKPG